MAKIQELPVKPAVLVWARKTAGLSMLDVAQELGVTTDFILDIESGNRRASKTLLHNLANLYKRPFTVLLLPEPPTDDDIPTDYRTLPVPKRFIGPDTAQSLREAKKLQEALTDISLDYPESFPIFRPISVSIKDNPNKVAQQIRTALNIDPLEQRGWTDTSHAFRQWRGKIQNLGILVILEDFPREEARGFSLWHQDLVPTIVVSRNEAPAAQIFTLFHELAHIYLRSDAICLKQESQTFLGNTEAWCNRVAAATLLPETELVKTITNKTVQDRPIEELANIASRYKVSRHVVAIRLETSGYTSEGYYNRIKSLLDPDDYAVVPKKPKEQNEIKRDIPRQRLTEVGFTAANAILSACKKSVLTTFEAADLLRVRPNKFKRLQDLASFQSQRYG
jgi:Zn-dependent peptidase ImmA (M78 family)